MRTLLKGFDAVATMDEERREILGGSVLVEDHRIAAVGKNVDTSGVDREIDGRGMVLLPGMVNTHHHFYQTLFRNVPGAANMELFDWLVFLYERWKLIDEDAVRTSASIAGSASGLRRRTSCALPTSPTLSHITRCAWGRPGCFPRRAT